MSESRTPVGERIEWTRYGDRQHESASIGGPVRYGDPQHDPGKSNPDAVERLGYEDDHWVDGGRRPDGGVADDSASSSDGGARRPAGESSSGAVELLA
ncbi:hypothetical protein [Halorussus ruber]|uniref:hypothetical protein n=1 Tax=Halorussus ruber TaxID=1126238 RepID=UPI0010921C3B|nr:hypothetical protein [Halorussus ruber]